MAEQTTNYTCPNCGGPVHFDASSGKLKCDYCGSIFTIDEIRKFYAEQNARAAAKGAASAAEQAAGETGGTASDAGEDDFIDAESAGADRPNVDTAGHRQSSGWDNNNRNLRVYHCNNCGAELICDASTAATTCPYCGNPMVIPAQFTMGRRPDSVIPFRWEKKQAVSKLQDYYKGKKLLPKSFTSGNHVDQVQGVYVPYWLFNGSVDASMQFECGQTTVTREGDFEVSRTRLFDVRREGTVSFEKIPCDAAKSMPDDLMDSIEPYDYSAIRPFALEYLPGYLANKYDVEQQDLQQKADDRAVNTTYQKLRDTVGGYSQVRELGKRADVHHDSTEYALFPVWLLYTRWNGQDFLFAMNGQSGKMTGNLPVDKGKTAGWFAGVSAICFALFSLLVMLFYEVDSASPFLVALGIALLMGGITVGAMVNQMKPVAAASGAGHYVTEGKSFLRVHTDQYIRTVETRTPVNRGGPEDGGNGPGGPHR